MVGLFLWAGDPSLRSGLRLRPFDFAQGSASRAPGFGARKCVGEAFAVHILFVEIWIPVPFQYAIQIARDWNTKDERACYVGYVLRFKVNRGFLENYEVHTAGGSDHQEYWIPAADLERFNDNIVGVIEVVAKFRRE
jgi:hypothetical protein